MNGSRIRSGPGAWMILPAYLFGAILERRVALVSSWAQGLLDRPLLGFVLFCVLTLVFASSALGALPAMGLSAALGSCAARFCESLLLAYWGGASISGREAAVSALLFPMLFVLLCRGADYARAIRRRCRGTCRLQGNDALLFLAAALTAAVAIYSG